MTRAVALAVAICLAAGTAAADKAPEWTKLPVDKYRCSRYAPGIRKTDPLTVHAPPGKPMIFTIGAASRDRSKISYRAAGLPAGATLDAKTGRFTWQIPKDAKGWLVITLYAASASAEIHSTFTLAIADPDLVAAWRAGMGSYEPDCSHRIAGIDYIDVDGDGQLDLVYTDGDESDDSANSGSYVQHVHRRVGAKFDTIDRALPNGSLDVAATPDGRPVVTIRSSCCCQAQLSIYRITRTGVDELLNVSGDDCGGNDPISVDYDAKDGITRVHITSGEPLSTETWSWRSGSYQRD